MEQARVDKLKARRLALWKRGEGKCGICEQEIPIEILYDGSLVNVDHIRPRAHGGGNDLSNLQIAHVPCNSEKADSCPGCSSCSGRSQRPKKPKKVYRFVLDDVEDEVVRRARHRIWRKNPRCVKCHEVVYASQVFRPEKVRFISQSNPAQAIFFPIHVSCIKESSDDQSLQSPVGDPLHRDRDTAGGHGGGRCSCPSASEGHDDHRAERLPAQGGDPASQGQERAGDPPVQPKSLIRKRRVPIEYPIWPVNPSWLRAPYGVQDACWGCGMEKEVGNLCFYCQELLTTLRRRAKFPVWII